MIFEVEKRLERVERDDVLNTRGDAGISAVGITTGGSDGKIRNFVLLVDEISYVDRIFSHFYSKE